jgi:hypothetical protein
MAHEASEYARICGVTNGLFLGDKETGLTPTEDLTQAYTSETLTHLDRTLRYQRKYLYGLAVREFNLANTMIGGKQNFQGTWHSVLWWYLGSRDSGSQTIATHGTFRCHVSLLHGSLLTTSVFGNG